MSNARHVRSRRVGSSGAHVRRVSKVGRLALAIGMGGIRVVFSRDRDGRTRGLHLEMQPVSAWKQPTATNPRRWAGGAVTAAGTALLVRRLRAGRRTTT